MMIKKPPKIINQFLISCTIQNSQPINFYPLFHKSLYTDKILTTSYNFHYVNITKPTNEVTTKIIPNSNYNNKLKNKKIFISLNIRVMKLYYITNIYIFLFSFLYLFSYCHLAVSVGTLKSSRSGCPRVRVILLPVRATLPKLRPWPIFISTSPYSESCPVSSLYSILYLRVAFNSRRVQYSAIPQRNRQTTRECNEKRPRCGQASRFGVVFLR